MKNKKHVVVFTMVIIFGVTTAFAQEHPAWSPKKVEEKKEHPEKTESKKPEDLSIEFSKAVEDYVKKTLAEKRTLLVQDVYGKEIKPALSGLKLEKIHKDKIINYEGDTYFACADFTYEIGKRKGRVDIDFFMTKEEQGWKIDRILLHKLDGKLQLMYEDNKPAPLKKERSKQEHPEHP
jgi:hypothetical protein